jgi:hypothetical protein
MLEHTYKVLIILIFIFGTIMFSGCQKEQSINAPESVQLSLSKFAIPVGSTLRSAVLNIYISKANNQDINLHRITNPWEENTITWNNFSSSYSPNIEGTFNANAIGYQSADVTNLVREWTKGTYMDYGILLDQVAQNYPLAQYHSKENSNPPYLRLEYILSDGNPITVDIQSVADAFIMEIEPTLPHNWPWLYTGWLNTNSIEKQTLLRFDIEPTPDGGCTLTPGYWKTHSIYGPAPYDLTWTQIGEDTPFFLSGKSYYQVLNTSPAGNAYYNLSFQYIAAKLNDLNGADFSAAQDAFNQATTLFNTYTPEQIALLKGSSQTRQQFISLAGILGEYNEGIIGPGHCD